MTAPMEPLGRMLPEAHFAAPPGEAIAGMDLRNLPHRRAAADAGSESIEIEPPPAAKTPAAPRIEGVAVNEDRAAAAPPAVARAMLNGPESEPLAGLSGKPDSAGLALNDLAPAAVAEVPALNRTARPMPAVLPEIRAEMDALAAPGAGIGQWRCGVPTGRGFPAQRRCLAPRTARSAGTPCRVRWIGRRCRCRRPGRMVAAVGSAVCGARCP